MNKNSFIKILSLFLFAQTVICSCDEKLRSSVPNTEVRFTCSLSQAPYSSIMAPGQFLTITKKGSAFVVKAPGIPDFTDGRTGIFLGYGGLILGYPAGIDMGGSSKYAAYDRACPYEAAEWEISRLELNSVQEGTCPTCKTVYDLNTGFPKKGISKERLKTYHVYLSGLDLMIRN